MGEKTASTANEAGQTRHHVKNRPRSYLTPCTHPAPSGTGTTPQYLIEKAGNTLTLQAQEGLSEQELRSEALRLTAVFKQRSILQDEKKYT